MKNIIYLLILITVSCKSYDFTGNKYRMSNKEEKIQIEFINDTLCEVRQDFLCDKLDDAYKKIIFKATYKIDKLSIRVYKNSKKKNFKSKVLILNNLECSKCPMYRVIPNYLELGCTNLDLIDIRIKKKIKRGVIYYMNNDTLVLKKDKIWFGNFILKRL